jgi:hypothetical protein
LSLVTAGSNGLFASRDDKCIDRDPRSAWEHKGVECDLGLTHRRKIPPEHSRYAPPFPNLLETGDSAYCFRFRRHHFTIERVHGLDDFRMHGFVLFEAKLLREHHL